LLQLRWLSGWSARGSICRVWRILARQARAICHDAVKAQGLQRQARDAEFEKCKADPASYLQLDQFTDDAEMSVE